MTSTTPLISALLFLAGLPLVGCAASEQDFGEMAGMPLSMSPPVGRAQSTCVQPLESYCAATPCLSYRASLVHWARVAAASRCTQDVTAGTCGPFLFISGGGSYGGTTTYFDRAGVLVAVRHFSDTNVYCERTSFTSDYGPVPQCATSVTQTLCTTRP